MRRCTTTLTPRSRATILGIFPVDISGNLCFWLWFCIESQIAGTMFVCIYTESGISTDTRLLSLLLVSTSSYLAGLKESANVVLVVVDIIANCCGRSRCLSLQQLLLLGCGKWRMRRRRLNGHCIHLCQLLLLSLLLLLLRRSPLPFTLAQHMATHGRSQDGVRGGWSALFCASNFRNLWQRKKHKQKTTLCAVSSSSLSLLCTCFAFVICFLLHTQTQAQAHTWTVW